MCCWTSFLLPSIGISSVRGGSCRMRAPSSLLIPVPLSSIEPMVWEPCQSIFSLFFKFSLSLAILSAFIFDSRRFFLLPCPPASSSNFSSFSFPLLSVHLRLTFKLYVLFPSRSLSPSLTSNANEGMREKLKAQAIKKWAN